MKAPRYREAWPTYAKLWDSAEIRADAQGEAAGFVSRATDPGHLAQYLALQHDSQVPWWLAAIIAERESGQDFTRSLAQGDRWDRVSRHEPTGRGPFPSWHAAAMDALKIDGLIGVQDWTLEKALYFLEKYNGFGYRAHGALSAYLWAGTNHQQRGKYDADGHWNPSDYDKQLGAVTMMKALFKDHPDLMLPRET